MGPKQTTSPARGWLGLDRTPRARVLLAEDDEQMRALLDSELRADGHEVFVANDGTEMLQAMSDLALMPFAVPDVIIMDVRMPGCSGLQLLAAMQAASWNIPVILITAFGDRRLHEDAARLGAATVLDKPFDLDDLRSAVDRVLRRGRPPPRPAAGTEEPPSSC